MHFTDNQTRYTLPLLLRVVHTTKMQKALILTETILWGATSIQKRYILILKGGATTALGGATIAD